MGIIDGMGAQATKIKTTKLVKILGNLGNFGKA